MIHDEIMREDLGRARGRGPGGGGAGGGDLPGYLPFHFRCVHYKVNGRYRVIRTVYQSIVNILGWGLGDETLVGIYNHIVPDLAAYLSF